MNELLLARDVPGWLDAAWRRSAVSGLVLALVAGLATATVPGRGERVVEQAPADAGSPGEARVVQLDFAVWHLDESKVTGLPFPSRAAATTEPLVLLESVSPLDDGTLASVRERLAAAERDAHASVLSKPRILVRDGEHASIESSFGDASVLTLAATPAVIDDGSIDLVMDFSHRAGEELQSVTRASGRLPLLMISRSGERAVVVLATGRVVEP